MAYEFSINLKDNVSEAAARMGSEVSSFAQKLQGVKGAVSGTTEKLAASKTAMQSFSAGLEKTISGMRMVTGEVVRFGKSIASGDFSAAITQLTSRIAEGLQKLDAVAPGLGSALSQMVPIFGGIISWGVGAVKSIFALGIEASTAKERTLRFYEALADGHATGEQVAGMIGKLANKIGWTSGQLKPLAKELMIMGHRDLPDLRRELVAAASAQALLGEGAADAYVDFARTLNAFAETGGKVQMGAKALERSLGNIGLSITDVAKKFKMSGEEFTAALKRGEIGAKEMGDAVRDGVTKKGQPALAAFRDSLDGIKNRIPNLLNKLFQNVNPKPLLHALSDIVEVFSRALNVGGGLTNTMNGLFEFAGKAVKWLTLAFLDVVIWIFQAIDAIGEFFSETGTGTDIVKALTSAFEAFKTVVEVVAASVAPLVEGLKLARDAWNDISGKSAATIAAGNKRLTATATKTADRISKSIEVSNVAPSFDFDTTAIESEKSGTAIGKSLADGLVSGLKAGGAAVVDASKQLGKAGADAIKSELQVKSPSKVTERIGGHVAEGFAVGVRRGTPDTASAMRDMSRLAFEGFPVNARGTPPDSDKRAGGNTYHVSVYVDGAGKEALEITEEMIAEVLERVALTQGL